MPSYMEHSPEIPQEIPMMTSVTFEDVNFGIILVGIYILFEFGSLQALYPVIGVLKLPLIVTYLSILYAVYLLLSNRIDIGSSTTRRFFLLIFFVITYSLIRTREPIELIKVFLIFTANYIIVVACLKKTSQYFLLLNIWLVSILFSSYHGIRQGGVIWGSRWFCDQNTLALVAAMAFPYAFILFKISKNKANKLFYILCSAAYISVNILANSRGGVLSMVLAAFFCWFLMENKVRNFIIIAIGLILVLLFAPPKLFDRMEKLWEQGTEEGTAADRIYLWGICIDMFQDHPIIGVGPSNYPERFSEYEKGKKYPLGAKRPPHSTPLQWLAEMGMVGVIILLMLQVALFRNWKSVIEIRDNGPPSNGEALLVCQYMSHANAISQITFWFGSIFLSLIPYPFYWILIPLSESWKNICNSHIHPLTEE
jgi:O-antigen ligase